MVVGRDSETSGSSYHVWRLNSDATLDTTFDAVDLGSNFSSPTSTDSVCEQQRETDPNRYQASCSYLNTFTVNESGNRYAVSFTREVRGAGNSTNYDRSITTLAVGDLATGQVIATQNTIRSTGEGSLSDWSQYSAIELGKTACTTGIGATNNGIPLSYSWLQDWSMMLRPNGSILATTECQYSNFDDVNRGTSVTEYEASVMVAVVPSGSSMVIDTSFGTNGIIVLQNDLTRCNQSGPPTNFNTGVKSLTSTDVFFFRTQSTYQRTTTVPDDLQSSGVTSYDGCRFNNIDNDIRTSITAFQVNGAIKNTATLPAGSDYYPTRWVIDQEGRWNSIVNVFSPGQDGPPSNTAIRLTKDGKLDTTNGESGLRVLSTLPSTVTVNGSSVFVNYFANGVANTAAETLFTGMASTGNAYSCNDPDTVYTRTYFPYYFGLDSGLLSTYGSDGLGEGVPVFLTSRDSCYGGFLASASFVDSLGRPRLVAQTRASGSQQAGLISVVWNAPSGVTGGGDGSGATSASTRTDNKVYSRKLPTRVQTNTALTVLTKKASRTRSLRSRTPKICVATRQEVVMVKKGSCTVEILNKSTGAKIRTLTTRVREADVEVGTTVTAENAVMFKRASTRLSKAAKAQIAEIAESASTAQRIILVGHTALLTEANGWNNFISLQRVARVKDALQAEFRAAGVDVPVTIVSLGSKAPLTTKQTEKAQTKNRRVNIYIVP